MKKYVLLLSILMIYASMAFGQGASVSLPTLNATVGQTITVPINVTNFNNVGSVTFNIKYNPNVLTYAGYTNQPSSGTFWADTSDGNLSILWYSTSGVNFTDKFVDVKFVFKGGSGSLQFVPAFEVTDPDGVVIPTTHSDGGIFGQLPTITIGTKNGTAGSALSVPVTAEKLSNIGAISLKIQYDPSVLTYVGSENILPNSGITVENTSGFVTINKYSGTAITTESAKLCDIKFNYISGSSDLKFVDADCELADGSGKVVVVDLVDGKVTGEQAEFTIGTLSAVAGAAVSIPVNAVKLTNVGAISLKIQYDPSVLTYVGSENVLPSSGITVENTSGFVTINKYSGDPITAASAKLCDIKFTYIGGSCDLQFVDAQCEVADGSGKVLPITLTDGSVSGEQATFTIGTKTALAGAVVSVPVDAVKLTNVGAISLKIQYDTNVLTYVAAENVLPNSGITVENANGFVTINKYSGDPITNASTKLCDIKFTYKNGNSALTFVDADCEIADGSGKVLPATLNDGAVNSASQTEVKITSKQAATGTQVIVPVNATNLSNVAAISLKIQYDTNVLTYVAAENVLPNSGITVENANGFVTINKYSGDPITSASARLCDIKFTYASGTSDLNLVDAECELADNNGTPISTRLTDGKVTPSNATKLILPNVYVKAGSVGVDVSVPVTVSKFSDVGSISLKIEYDPTILTYKSAENLAVSSIDVSDASGVVTIGWYRSTPLTLADNAKLLDLKFNFKKAQTAQMTFDQAQCEVSNSTGTVLYIQYTDGKVAANQLPKFSKSMPDSPIEEKKLLSFKYVADDPDQSAITYSLESAPAGAAINATSGTFSWTPTSTQVRKDPYKIIVVASDGIDQVKDTALVQVNLTDVEVNSSKPTHFELSQNNPNPFNPTTKIKYALPQESRVVLKVYNLLGQEVATLVNEFQNAGFHTVQFDATNLTTGLYLYKLDADNFTAIKKMMLVK